MKVNKYYLLIIILFLTSFSDANKERNLILKVWVFENYDNEILVYRSQKRFSKESSGFQLQEGGKLKVKQNSSWCGTAPITYEIVEGNWRMISDSIISFDYKYWGGNKIEKRKIIELTSNKLILKILK